MKKEGEEFEIVKYPRVDNINIFFVNLINRTTHIHRDMEFCYVMGGELLIRSKSGEFTAPKGSLLYFNSHEPHSLKRLSGPSPLLSVQISQNICRRIFPRFENICFTSTSLLGGMTGEGKEQLTAALYRLTHDYFLGGFGFELSVASEIFTLFSLMLKESDYKVTDREESLRNRERQSRLTRITNYLNENLAEKITLTDLASRENLSPTYLSHFFRSHFDITFQEYLSNLRFERAIKLMAGTNLKILDICMEAGFSDRKYMNKAFYENCGCSPREYRDHLKERTGDGPDRPRKVHPLTNQYIYHDDDEIREMLEKLRDIIG